MSKIRVKLDLSNFYVDKRRFAYVLVDLEWKNVKCFQRHVEKLFGLPNIEFLTEDLCYLPPRENIGIINTGDVLRVVESDTKADVEDDLIAEGVEFLSKKKKKSKTREKTDSSFEYKENIQNNEHRIVHNTPDPVINDREEKKTRKRKHESSVVSSSEKKRLPSNGGVVTDAVLSVKKLKNIFDQKLDKCDSHISNNSLTEKKVKNTTIENTAEYCDSEDEKAKPKGKRKRKRKKKSKQSAQVSEESFKRSITSKETNSKSTPIVSAKSSEHIRFDDEGNAVADAEENIKTTILFTCFLDDLPSTTARIIKGISTMNPLHVTNESRVYTMSIFSDVDGSLNQKGTQELPEVNQNKIVPELPPENGVILQREESFRLNNSPIFIEDTSQIEETTLKNNGCLETDKTQIKPFSTKHILSLSEPLVGDPTIGDILLFKIYRLNENNEPSLSDYICGKLESIEETTKFLKIFVIDGQDQLIDSEGNSFLNMDNSPDYVFFKCEDLIDKKVFKM